MGVVEENGHSTVVGSVGLLGPQLLLSGGVVVRPGM